MKNNIVDEVWKEVKDFPGYFVSTFGRVWSRRGTLLKYHLFNNAYRCSLYSKEKKYYQYRNVGKLVYETFVRKLEGNEQITMIDGNIKNLCLDNLKVYKIKKRGKLSDSEIKEIFKLRAQGLTMPYIAEKFSVSTRLILNVLNRKTYTEIVIDQEILNTIDELGKITAKLNEKRVEEIREKRKAGYSLKQLKKEYDISYGTISQICNNKIWYNPEYIPPKRFAVKDEKVL